MVGEAHRLSCKDETMILFRTFLGLLALILTGFILSVSYAQPTQTQVSAQKPNVDIAVIHFRGGRLVQSTEQFGRWFEKRNTGEVNYEFFETASTSNSFELTGPNGEVKLFVDLAQNVISGQWPGQTRKPIYTIKKIDKLVLAQTPPLPPVVNPPVPTPPVVHPPATPPASNPNVPLPKDIKSATYSGGQFMHVSSLVWEESTQTGQSFHYQVVGYDEQSLYLYDASRRSFVTLEPASKRAKIAVEGGYLTAYRRLTSVSGMQETPLPPTSGGALSAAEKLACVQNGGFVERAGLLGAERCTQPFSDAGLVCTDSGQCQGQCRGTLNTDVGADVTGVCQATDNPFGCFSEVLGGKAGPGLCVD
jgi:hypothetical protein